MKSSALVAAVMLTLTPLPAAAQAPFGNPFSDATAYQSERGSVSDAHYRVRYEATITARGAAPVVSELTLDVADDWVLARDGNRATLYDFRLNRVFTLSPESFVGQNGLAAVAFRIMERQNRSVLQRVVQAAGAQAQQLPDACDAETELSLVIPGAPDAGATLLRERSGAIIFVCSDREMGGFTPGDSTAPLALWPAIYAEMPTHPALHHRMREDGHAPARLNVSYREGAASPSERSWRLISSEAVATPYPLQASLRNATADMLDGLVAGAGRAGADSVAGRTDGGPPTLQSWDAHLRDVSQREGPAAASMLLSITFNLFPDLQCTQTTPHAACELARGLRALRDPAPIAMLQIGAAEQRGDTAGVIAAMRSARASPLRDHPALGASYALAIPRFDERALARARAANLPTDPIALQNRGLLAFPYNPAYWTDVGDRYGASYDWASAFLFYDTAYSLPMPTAIASNMALAARRTQMERIRTDFPDAFLPAPR